MINIKHTLKTFIHAGFIILALSVTNSSHALNEPHCDPQVLDMMKSHAWITAQREISQNQNLIYKPDSTLEYSCFDWLAVQMGFNWQPRPEGVDHNFSQIAFIDPYFTDPVRQGLPPSDYAPTIDDGTTELAIREIVVAAMAEYIQLNFKSNYLAERSSLNYANQVGANRAEDRYECTQMAQVWNDSRCINFMVFPEDGFYDFAWYTRNDPRKRPSGYRACAVPGPFQATLEEAFNKKQDFFTVDPTVDQDEFRNDIPYMEDKVNPHYDMITAPKEIGQNSGREVNPNTCASVHKIRTGNKVIEVDGSETDEWICLSPSCTYSGGQCR
jgi:hypothetical protein